MRSVPRVGAGDRMNKSAPSFGRIAAMVVFALSCFGLLLFLWLAFGGAVPLKPKGYRSTSRSPRRRSSPPRPTCGSPACPSARSRRSSRTSRRAGRSSRSSSSRATRRCRRRAGDPAPEDAARRDLRRAHARHRRRGEGARERHAARRRRSRTRCSSTRSSARSTPTRAPRSRPGCRSRRRGSAATGATSTTRSATSRRSPRTPRSIVDILNRQEGAVTQPGLQHRRGVRRAERARRPAAVADRELQPRVRRRPRRATSELKQAFIALPTFERESELTLDRLADVRADDRPADHAAAAGRPRAQPDAAGPRRAVARPRSASSRTSGPLIDASRTGFPAAEQFLEDARPLIAQLEPATRQLTPILQFLGLYKPELTAFFANSAAATQARRTAGKIHYLRTTNPLNAENLAVYPRRIGTNRPNAYTKSRNFLQLQQGMPVFDNRHCGAGIPRPPTSRSRRCRPPSAILVPDALLDEHHPVRASAARTGATLRRRRAGSRARSPSAARPRSTRTSTSDDVVLQRIVRAAARRPGRVLADRRRAGRRRQPRWRCGWSRARRRTRSSAAGPTRSRPPSATARSSATTR